MKMALLFHVRHVLLLVISFLIVAAMADASFIPAPFLTKLPFALLQGPACSNLYLNVPANGSNVAVAAVPNATGLGSLWTLQPINDPTHTVAAFSLRSVAFGTYLALPAVPVMNNCSPVFRAVSNLDVTGWFEAVSAAGYPDGSFALRSLASVDPSAYTVLSFACGAGQSVTAVPSPSGCEMLQLVFR